MTDLEARSFRKARVSGVTCLVPNDVHADEFLETIGMGKEVLITGRRARNMKHHRLLFAVLRIVWENTDLWETEAALLQELKVLTGLYDIQVSKLTGEVFQVPRSISFAAMTQDVFTVWFDQAVKVLAEEALKTDYASLSEEVRKMTGETW